MKNYLVTLANWAHVPTGSIHRGNGKIDFKADVIPGPAVVKEKLKEVNNKGVMEFVKPGEKTKTAVELVKEGKPIAKDPKIKGKPVDPEPIGVIGGGKKP